MIYADCYYENMKGTNVVGVCRSCIICQRHTENSQEYICEECKSRLKKLMYKEEKDD